MKTTRSTSPAGLVEVTGVALLFVVYACGLFQISSGAPLRGGIGDWFDPYFINFLLEHWYHSLTSLADPTSPPMFFPARDTLGYSHGLMLFAPFYAIVRPFLGPFVAESAALFLVIVTGSVSLFVLLRRFAGLSLVGAVVLSAFFVTSPNITNEAVGQWIQRASVFCIPMVMCLACAARGRQGWTGLPLAWMAGFGALSIFTQDFYTGMLSALVAALLLSGAVLVLQAPLTGLGATSPDRGRSESTRMLAAGIGAAMGAGLFLLIYLGPYREHRTFPADQLMQQLWGVRWRLWRTPWEMLTSAAPYSSVRPFVLVMVLSVAMATPALAAERGIRRYGLWILAVAMLVFLIPYSFDSFSLWRWTFASLPGLSAIRDPKRIIEPYELAVTLTAAWFVTRPRVPLAMRRTVIAAAALVMALTWNTSTFRFDRQLDAFRAAVDAPLQIDPSCRSFFIKAASETYMSRSAHMQILYGMDAAFIALEHGIPTLNGYSAWSPPGWGSGLANPQEAPYSDAVRDWVAHWHLEHVCVLDIEARTMVPYVAPVGR